MTKEKPKWKRLEDLVYEIQKTLTPNANVILDDKIRGKKTGTIRQVDVSVKANIGGFPIFIAIDAKDYAHPIDIGEIGSVMELFDDVGANQGVVVAPNGFTSTARKRAEEAGLTLLKPVDTGDHDWRAIVRIPSVAHISNLESFQLKLLFSEPAAPPKIMSSTDDNELMKVMLYSNDGNELGIIEDLLFNAWNGGVMPHETGAYDDLKFCDGATYVMEDDKLIQIEFRVAIRVTNYFYFTNLSVDKISGFQHINDDTKITTKAMQLSDISLEKIFNEWSRIESIDDLMVTPTVRMHLLTTTSLFRDHVG